ncbi:N5-glutamine methyltransferase family protein [Streptomyces cacaoi]
MTLKTLIEEAAATLSRGGDADAQHDAERLAARVLGVDVAALPFDTVPGDRTVWKFRKLVARRADGVPLGHLTGTAVFCGLELAVGPGVFVPRVHSEAVLERGLRAVAEVTAPVVADLCAGSGALALAAAHRRPDARVHAVEFDPIAAGFARRNSARRAELGDTPVTVHEQDLTRPGVLDELTGRVDLVLANPPFMPEESRDLPAEFSRHQPRQAIYAGPDGLRLVRATLQVAVGLLRPGGTLVVEHGHLHGETVPELLSGSGFEEISGHPDHDGWPLFSAARKPAAAPPD